MTGLKQDNGEYSEEGGEKKVVVVSVQMTTEPCLRSS